MFLLGSFAKLINLSLYFQNASYHSLVVILSTSFTHTSSGLKYFSTTFFASVWLVSTLSSVFFILSKKSLFGSLSIFLLTFGSFGI